MSIPILNNIDLNKNEIQNAVIQVLGTAPSGGKPGQVYYNSVDKCLYLYNGTSWVRVGITYTPASAAPLMDGTAAVGTSAKYAREDHVHPSDTTKVDKVSGKGLSANDYTTTEKNKLAGIASGAEVNVQADWNVTDSTSDAFIKNKPTIPSGVSPATATPLMDGTGAVGTSGKFAREDHVHPSDTTKVDKVTGKGLSTNDYTNADKSLLDSLGEGFETFGDATFDGATMQDLIDTARDVVHYAVCSTAAGTAEKTVSADWLTSFTTGVWIAVKFANTNTAAVADLTLKVGSYGAKNIKYRNANLPSAGTLAANRIYLFVYDGTYWQIVGDLDTDTKYTAASSAPPKIASASAQGSSTNYARQDHTHGIDLATGDSNGQVKIAGTNVNVKGLGAAAYMAAGSANGVATLGSDGKVPSAQLPSYVDDVEEYSSQSAFPATGEAGKIYVDTSTNKTYRWSGTAYVEISASLALGETSSTAYRGDRGKTAYDHASAKGSAFSSGLYKITTNSEGHVTGATAVQKSDITGLGIPAQDTTYNDATSSTHGLMSAADKAALDDIANALGTSIPFSYREDNPALTSSSGICTWTVTHNLGRDNVMVSINEISSGKKVLAEVVETSETVLTIKMISASNIAAATYSVTVIG